MSEDPIESIRRNHCKRYQEGGPYHVHCKAAIMYASKIDRWMVRTWCDIGLRMDDFFEDRELTDEEIYEKYGVCSIAPRGPWYI